MTHDTHTPGPAYLVVHPDGWTIQTRPKGMGLCIAKQYADSPQETGDLLASSYTSYDKHCGPRAVELAEADLLGQCIDALREIQMRTGGFCQGSWESSLCRTASWVLDKLPPAED